jgi:hypothetical protein
MGMRAIEKILRARAQTALVKEGRGIEKRRAISVRFYARCLLSGQTKYRRLLTAKRLTALSIARSLSFSFL